MRDLETARFYSILIDESTDIATDHTLIQYVCYVLDGCVSTKFLELTELPRGTAPAIPQTLLKVLEKKMIPVGKVCSMATDGCSVMVGVQSAGVTTRLKQINPWVLSTHCIARRLALARGQAADSDRYLKRYQDMINAIYKFHHYSGKHSAILKEMQAILNSAERKFKQTFHTRWLSFDGAVDAILANLDPLISALIGDSDSDPSAEGLLKFISNFSLLVSTHFLCDVLPLLSRLSKSFQQQQVDFTAISDGVSVTVAALESLKSTPGPRLRKYLGDIPDIPQEYFYFMGHQISDTCSQTQCSDISKNRDTFIDHT